MHRSLSSRFLARIGQIEKGEALTAILMLLYSFLAIAGYSIIKPITRSRFIDSLGADNLPYVLLVAGFLISAIMVVYGWVAGRLPRRWTLPITQGGIIVLLVVFWFLFQTRAAWVSVVFFIAGLIIAVLLISQFWTLANVIYDARQAKRLFGFIGAGSPLGGLAGSLITARYAKSIGTVNLLLVSAAILVICMAVSVIIIRREKPSDLRIAGDEEKGVGWRAAIDLLRSSKHLQIIALVIGFAALAANIIETQLNLATEAMKGSEGAMAGFLASVQAWTSGIGFLIQILLTSRIHRFLGVGFALLILPMSLGGSGVVMLLNAALWAPSLARILDTSLRYSVDKTTREILFMPLPADIKIQAKPFVDVSVDRMAKALSAAIVLPFIKPWGLHLNWQQVSYLSLGIMILWVLMAIRARRGYLEAFRRSIEAQDVKPSEIRLAVADLSTIETLVQELGEVDDKRVLYAIDILESLGRQNLVTPLILHHDSPKVRVRALALLDNAPPGMAERWMPALRRLAGDPDTDVRTAAVGALASLTEVDTAELARPWLQDENPRIVMTAAMVLARSQVQADRTAAEEVLHQYAADPRDSAGATRRELAEVLRHVPDGRFRQLLIPLLADSDMEVAREALRSVRQLGPSDFVFVPALVSLLRHPQLKGGARGLLIGYGEEGLDVLAHVLRDAEEDFAIRLQIPATIGRIPCRKAADVLLSALEDPDPQLRQEVVAALARIRRQTGIEAPREPVEKLILAECEIGIRLARLRGLCFSEAMPARGRLLARALDDRIGRAADNLFDLLRLLYPWKDIAAAQFSVARGGATRSRALEYLDNLLPSALRKRVLPLFEQSRQLASAAASVTQNGADAALRGALKELMHDADPAIASSALHMVREKGLKELDGDVEQLLASGPTRDLLVFEAASWTLAALHVPEDQLRALWLEALPAVEIAARLSLLPLFASVSIEELMRMARSGRQGRFGAGETIFDGRRSAQELHFLLQGKVVRREPSEPEQGIEAPAPLNFDEVLLGSTSAASGAADSPCITLGFSFEEFHGLMAASAGLTAGLLRFLCVHASEEIGELVLHAEGYVSRPWPDELRPVDKAMILGSFPAFKGISREEMLALAAAASVVRGDPARPLFEEMDPPAFHALAAGSVVLEDADGEPPITARAGDGIGLYQMMAGIPLIRRGKCAGGSLLLRIEREDFLDLLMQRPGFVRELMTSLFAGRVS